MATTIITKQVEIAVPIRRTTKRALAPAHVWQLALGWVLLIPMLYVAANGTFIPHEGGLDYSATSQTPGTSASHKVILALVCLIWFTLIGFRFSSVFALSRRAKVILAFPVLAVLSSCWSADPLQSIVSGTVLFIFTLFAIYVAGQFPFQRQFEFIMLVGAVALPVSIALALLVPSMGASDAGWRGIFGHKQVCAALSMFWLITALHWKSSGIVQELFRAISVVMAVVLIVMSQSRTGWALTLVALSLSGALWLLQKLPATQALLIVLLSIPLLAAVLYGLFFYFPFLVSFIGKDATLSQRTVIWGAAWQAITRHPVLGYGFAAFWKGLYGPSQSVVLVAGWGLQQAQDGFLDVWLGVGVVGIALIALTTGQAMRNAARCFHSKANAAYVRWCIVVILCSLLYNIGETSLGMINMDWLFFLLACLGLKQDAMRDTRSVYSTRD
jgi:exopolysaccharide production protein ExoQ